MGKKISSILTPESMKYEIRIYHNSFFLEEKDVFREGPFTSLEEARNKAMEIVRKNMQRFSKSGRKAYDIYTMWAIYGENPVIFTTSGTKTESDFSASDYALKVAEEFALKKPSRGRPSRTVIS
jgi:hypothetical protein